MLRHLDLLARGCVIVLVIAGHSHAQTGYGVDSTGKLFSFDVTVPGSIPITSIGNLGFVPEGIDFQPGSNRLYAIDIGPVTSQLYVVNITSAVAKPGASFPTVGAGYDLTGNPRFGFDFIPNTFDGSANFLIRLVSTNGDNLRINSESAGGPIVDTDLLIPPSSAPFVDASAYINNLPTQGTGATTLYDMDSRNDSLYTQNPPNNGTLNLVGAFGASVDALAGIGFDIYTDPLNADPTIVGDSAYAVLQRSSTQSGAYLLYQVDLATGAITTGKLVGPNGTPADFTGGFAMAPGVPEPASLLLVLSSAVVSCFGRRHRR